VDFRAPELASLRLGMPIAFNICGNGFQNHCEKLETADSETKQYGVGKTG
jgi:hypothetical protein